MPSSGFDSGIPNFDVRPLTSFRALSAQWCWRMFQHHHQRRWTVHAEILRMSEHQVEPHVFVILGATGDLTRRKLLPALYHLRDQESANPT